jgi:hypothetical protein
MMASIVKERRGDVEAPNAVMVPRLALSGRVVDHHKLSGGGGWGGPRNPRETVPGGEGRV